MHAEERARSAEARKGRAPARQPQAASPTPPPGLLALQSTVGNAAVVQMLRRAGHPGAQERHQHRAGCNHQQTEPEQQPAVQRSAVHDVLRTSGQPLDDATRTDMEARLGADFSDVRIHNDAAAKASAAEIGARAYTSGNHVVVGDGGGDKHTLSHELTHVIQQRQGPVASTDNGNGLKVSDPSDRFEREAEANASWAMAASPQAAPNLQRHVARSHTPASLPSVQRAYDHDNPTNPQNVMTIEHWERKAKVIGVDGKATEDMVKTKKRLIDSVADRKKDKKNKKSGTKRKMDDIIKEIGPGLLRQLQGKPKEAGKLELYRAMSLEEARSIMEYWGSPAQAAALEYVEKDGGSASDFKAKHKGMTIGAHLGDLGQAEAYHAMRGEAYHVLLKFTLKPGAHELLFNPEYMALGPTYKTELIREATKGKNYQNSSENEGALPGYIGVKSEENEPFSVAIAQGANNNKKGREVGPSQLLFQLFIEDVNVVKNTSGTLLPGEAVPA